MDNSPSNDFFLNLEVNECKKKLTSREVILSLLRERNWKQVELAEKIGLSRQALNNYLRGFWIFPTSIKIKIAEAFKVDSSVIWDLEK
jgi:transcriptional regulator with XRE-family HTH domain